jgi:hypothetical protein
MKNAPLAQKIDPFQEAYKIQALKSDCCENRTKTSITIASMKQNKYRNHLPVLYIQSSMKE